MRGRTGTCYGQTRSSAIAEKPRDALSRGIMSTAVLLYEKFHLKRFAVDEWPWRSLNVNGITAIQWSLYHFLLVVRSYNVSVSDRFLDIDTFYPRDAMLVRYSLSSRVSVRPSFRLSQVGVLLRRLNIRSQKQYRRDSSFTMQKISKKFR